MHGEQYEFPLNFTQNDVLEPMVMVTCANDVQNLNSIFPPKIKWISKYSCDDNACHVMQDLETRGQNKNLAKRTTWFGVLVEKLCPFEVPCSLGQVLIISP